MRVLVATALAALALCFAGCAEKTEEPTGPMVETTSADGKAKAGTNQLQLNPDYKGSK